MDEHFKFGGLKFFCAFSLDSTLASLVFMFASGMAGLWFVPEFVCTFYFCGLCNFMMVRFIYFHQLA